MTNQYIDQQQGQSGLYRGIENTEEIQRIRDSLLALSPHRYNDHHYHYGYFLYAAAAFGKSVFYQNGTLSEVSGQWLRGHGARYESVLTLARDIANPSESDGYFPVHIDEKEEYFSRCFSLIVHLFVFLFALPFAITPLKLSSDTPLLLCCSHSSVSHLVLYRLFVTWIGSRAIHGLRASLFPQTGIEREQRDKEGQTKRQICKDIYVKETERRERQSDRERDRATRQRGTATHRQRRNAITQTTNQSHTSFLGKTKSLPPKPSMPIMVSHFSERFSTTQTCAISAACFSRWRFVPRRSTIM